MKKSIVFLSFCLSSHFSFSQVTNNQNVNGIDSIFTIQLALFSLLLLSSLIIQNFIFRKKIKNIKTENQTKITEITNVCVEKISKSEIEMLKTLNASITEIHSDYMNKIIQIRTDIELHRSKIIFLMENNKEMKEFYDEMIKDHFNPIIQNLN